MDMTQGNMPKHKTWLMGVVAILVIVLAVYVIVLTRNALAAYSYIGRSESQIYTIGISGLGKVTATPDIASISLGVVTQGTDVAKAQQENTDKMNKIIGQLKGLGIADADLKTVGYSIYPRYEYPNGREVLKGYEISQSLEVKIRDLKKISEVLALAASSGANQLSGLNFTIDDMESLRQQARELALQNAKEKAESLAKIAGVRLGKLVSFSEDNGGGGPIPYPVYADGMGGGASGMEVKAMAPEVSAGSQDVTVNVTVTYEVL